MNFYPDERNL